MSHGRDPARAEAIVGAVTEEASMCFAHSGTPSDALHVQAGVGVDAAEAFTALAEADGLGSAEVTGSGTPDAVVAPAASGCSTASAGSCTTAGTVISSPL